MVQKSQAQLSLPKQDETQEEPTPAAGGNPGASSTSSSVPISALMEQVTALIQTMSNVEKKVTAMDEWQIDMEKKQAAMSEHFEQLLATLGTQLGQIQNNLAAEADEVEQK